MNKLGLLSFILMSAGLTMVGCTSTQSPETAHANQQIESVDQSAAQSLSIESGNQNGAAVQTNPALQQAEPQQAIPMGDVPESQQPVQ